MFTQRRFPLVPIGEDKNVIPESGERVGVLGTQSAKKQLPSGSSFRIRRAMQRRSCVPSFSNTESSKENEEMSTPAYSSKKNQDVTSAIKPQESFGQSPSMFEPRLARMKRRRSRLLMQDEGSETKARDKDNDCHQSATVKQDESIVDNKEETSWRSSQRNQLKIEKVISFLLLISLILGVICIFKISPPPLLQDN